MIYNTLNTFNESVSVNIDLDRIEESAYEPGIVGAMQHVLESEQNWNTIMEAVAFDELAYFAENGTTMIYEAGSMGGFFAKIKAFFKKIIEKIASLFKKFIAMLDSFTKTDAEFVKKYRSQLLKVSTTDFEFKGYDFTVDKVTVRDAAARMDKFLDSKMSVYTATLDTKVLTSTTTAVRENREDILEETRGKALGINSRLSATEFNQELAQLLRGGEDSPITIDSVNVSDLLTTISGTKEAKKAAEKEYKDLKKVIEDNIKSLEKIEKEYAKSVPDKDADKSALASASVAYISTATSLMREVSSILQLINGAILSAIKAENRQAKAVCVKLLTYKPKNESAFGESAGSSHLNGVVLI